ELASGELGARCACRWPSLRRRGSTGLRRASSSPARDLPLTADAARRSAARRGSEALEALEALVGLLACTAAAAGSASLVVTTRGASERRMALASSTASGRAPK